MLLSNLQATLANGAGKVSGIHTTDTGSVLIGTLKNARTLNGKLAATGTLDLNVKRLRTEILIIIIDHILYCSFQP
jgi:hypothetical protein